MFIGTTPGQPNAQSGRHHVCAGIHRKHKSQMCETPARGIYSEDGWPTEPATRRRRRDSNSEPSSRIALEVVAWPHTIGTEAPISLGAAMKAQCSAAPPHHLPLITHCLGHRVAPASSIWTSRSAPQDISMYLRGPLGVSDIALGPFIRHHCGECQNDSETFSFKPSALETYSSGSHAFQLTCMPPRTPSRCSAQPRGGKLGLLHVFSKGLSHPENTETQP